MLNRMVNVVVNSGMWLVGGGLLVVLAGAVIALGPMAIARWL